MFLASNEEDLRIKPSQQSRFPQKNGYIFFQAIYSTKEIPGFVQTSVFLIFSTLFTYYFHYKFIQILVDLVMPIISGPGRMWQDVSSAWPKIVQTQTNKTRLTIHYTRNRDTYRWDKQRSPLLRVRVCMCVCMLVVLFQFSFILLRQVWWLK